MKKIITRVCALCLAASMVFPSGQAMAGEIQKEAPGQYAVYSEDSQNEMPDDSSESTNHKKGEDDSEINMEKAVGTDSSRRKTMAGKKRKGKSRSRQKKAVRQKLEKRDSRLKMTKTNVEQQGKVQLRLIRAKRRKKRKGRKHQRKTGARQKTRKRTLRLLMPVKKKFPDCLPGMAEEMIFMPQ